jgi:hypothetical protein
MNRTAVTNTTPIAGGRDCKWGDAHQFPLINTPIYGGVVWRQSLQEPF